MKKGDMRRQSILDMAERLFYEKGYEHTSVQDVLDAMELSKGGFYHHFESKLSLLEAICVKRCEIGYQRCEAEVRASRGTAIDKLNAMFEFGFFFGQTSRDFLMLMVNVIYRDGCVQLKDMLQKCQLRLYLPLMNEVVHEGISEQLFFTMSPDSVSRIILMMNNCMTDEVSDAIVKEDGSKSGLFEVLDLINAYRASVELLLNAPYGSIRLLELDRAAEIIREQAGNSIK